MKQIIQDLKSGNTILEEVPTPQVTGNTVLIKTSKTLVSLGTERMLVEFGKANLIEKARQQPDKVKMVLDKIKTDGLMPTLEAVFNKLGQPIPLGYCNVGEVVAVGHKVKSIKVGDRVASNGNHAEYVSVPENLVAKIPDNVTDSQAAFTVIGAIGLQGIRLLNPTLGEKVVVIGLGLIGLITAELLKMNGCEVIGFDFDQAKIDHARSRGIEAVNLSDGADPVKVVEAFTDGVGADGVIITASNKSNDIISNAAKMSRKRGRIVLVGVIGLNISRADFYEKELTFQVSCSYGPGRYDEVHEQKGQDYPLPYVRWTEKRNFETVLSALSQGTLAVDHLITEEVALDDYNRIYDDMKSSSSIASIITYNHETDTSTKVAVANGAVAKPKAGTIGIIGAGNFTGAVILPELKKSKARVKYIASAKGLSAKILARKFNVDFATTDINEILNDEEVNTVLVTTRHGSHAHFALEALNKGKHVFVEKPLALSLEDLDKIAKTRKATGKSVVVGFNRRFSPHIKKIKSLIGDVPANFICTMNAGFIPPELWLHDLESGGGRIIGEACHYMDLLVYLTGSKVKSVCMNALGQNPEINTDNASILLRFENGSQGVINYFANGSKSYSKERIEVHSQERTLICDNFRLTKGYGTKGFSKLKTRQNKGNHEQFKRLKAFATGKGEELIPFDEIYNVSKATLLAVESLKTGAWVDVC